MVIFMEQIAVVGCGGMIGEVICKNLCKDFMVKGGQRREPTAMLKLDNFKWCFLDIFDATNLNDFCVDCALVINCAGPEFVIKDRVAQAAMRAGAIYVDVSNAILLNKEQETELAANGVHYVGAGFYPGVTGLLLRRVLYQLLDETEHVNCYVGGSERYTKTSLSDILMSAYSTIGKTDSYWKEKSINTEKINIMKKEFVTGIEAPVYKKPYLGREILDVLKHSLVQELHWYNIAPNDFMFQLAVQFYQMQLELSIEEALNQLESHLESQPKDEWVAFVIDAIGVKNAKNVKYNLNLQMKTSFELTGSVAAKVARLAISSTRKNGIYWAHEVLPLNFMNEYVFTKEQGSYVEKVYEKNIYNRYSIINTTYNSLSHGGTL